MLSRAKTQIGPILGLKELELELIGVINDFQKAPKIRMSPNRKDNNIRRGLLGPIITSYNLELEDTRELGYSLHLALLGFGFFFLS